MCKMRSQGFGWLKFKHPLVMMGWEQKEKPKNTCMFYSRAMIGMGNVEIGVSGLISSCRDYPHALICFLI